MIALDPGDDRYPAGLRDLATPPRPLFVEGDLSALHARAVAIVGTRRMTGYGERVARELAASLASSGVVVVSGLAQGIDSAAHRGALDAGGRTIAVLGESIPTFCRTVSGRRRPLVPRIRSAGALVSEYVAPLTPKPWTYVRRDATIAALAEAVVVVEAPAGSGALITAADARRLGRALYAVPGPLGSSASVGTNALIARGEARALVSATDLRMVIGGDAPVGQAAATDPLVEALRDGPLGLDELARRIRVPLPVLSARVATLLLRGVLVGQPDGRLRLA
ncbi:MAG TPA: DNA-processing protein DprA [Candidatus Limnocylindria bacterium]|nr:DNA-processing protein DprA [Candidatus Limnocylindria bacterium]